MKPSIVLMLATASLPLTACAYGGSQVKSNVAVFHTLDQVPQSATYSVVSWRPELDRSLEFRSYALRLTEIMRDEGYRAVSPGQPADYIVYLDYGIDDGTPFEYTYNRPQWGMVANGEQSVTTITETGTGQIINQTVTPTNETYAVTGYTQETRQGTRFNRFVNIDIVSRTQGRQQPAPVFELRLTSSGSCGSIPTVMPRFMQAVEKRFSAKSGKAGKISTRGVKC